VKKPAFEGFRTCVAELGAERKGLVGCRIRVTARDRRARETFGFIDRQIVVAFAEKMDLAHGTP
jgi:hypothetical protein